MSGGREARRGDGRQQPDLRGEPAGRRDPPQRRAERVVAHERGGAGGQIADTYGLDGGPRVQRGLEDGGPEAALGPAAPGRAFGEGDDARSAGQRGRHLAHGAGQRSQPVALQEEGAASGGERPEQRPAPDLTLGQHPSWQGCRDQRYVQPGDVVGDDQSGPGAERATGDPYAYPEGAYHRTRPAAGQQVPDPGAEEGSEQRGRRCEEHTREHHQRPGQQPGECPELAGRRSVVGGAARRGAGRAGQPDAHRTGARERKCRR